MSASTRRRFVRSQKQDVNPHPIDIGDEEFHTIPTLGTKALEPIARVISGDVSALFDAAQALLVEDTVTEETDDGPIQKPAPEGTAFRRFVDLDLDLEDELMDVFALLIEPYGLAEGESSASSERSSTDEASSSSTSSTSTDSTGTSSSQTPEPIATGSFI